MTTSTIKTFVIERGGKPDVEIQANRGVQDAESTRVTFFIGEASVGSFINVSGWYEKPAG